MDPYLEQPALWPNVHSSLIIAMRDELAPRLRPKYYVSVEERTVQLGPDDLAFSVRPDVAVQQAPPRRTHEAGSLYLENPTSVTVQVPMPEEMQERYLEIREAGLERVVTVVELLSPANKVASTGRRAYERKRLGILGSLTHLVEIDLLRRGDPLPVWGYSQPSDYRILVSRAPQRPQAQLFPFSVRQAIPPFSLPVAEDDPEPEVDLNRLLHEVYDRAGYDLRIDYDQSPDPPLAPADAHWAREIVGRVE